MNFQDLTRPTLTEDRDRTAPEPGDRRAWRFDYAVPEGFRQGRGAFGGLVVAALARAAEQVEAAPERPLRSVQSALLAPVAAGPSRIELSPLRIGSGVSTYLALLRQEGEVRAQATLVYGRRRVEDPGWAPQPPDMGRPAEVGVLSVGPPFGPEFGQHFEFRPTGPLPFSQGPAESAGWVEARPALERLTAPDVLALLDTWWPAALVRESRPRPMATLAYTAQLLMDPGAVSQGPLYFRARADVQVEGFSVELRELWTPQGQLVGLNQQTFVTIR